MLSHQGVELFDRIKKTKRHFSAIPDSSVENSLFSSVPHLLIGLFGSLESNFLSFLYILDISPLSDVGLVKDLLPICWLPFCPLPYRRQLYEVTFVDS